MENELCCIEISSKIEDILKSNKILDPVADVIMENSGLRGDNMTSKVKWVTVNFINDVRTPLNLFLKQKTVNPSHSTVVTESKLFEKESMFFTQYLPQASEFCKANGQEHLLDIYPKCYYGDETMIVFENLVKDKNYILLDKEDQHDFESAQFALKTLAKHHAISYAFIKHIGGHVEFSKRFPDLDFEIFKTSSARGMIEPIITNAVTTFVKILESSNAEGKEEAITMFKSHAGKAYDLLMEALDVRELGNEEDIRVLNHGDYWNNNMMFLKNPVNGNINGHIAIDFQLLRYCTSSLDLSYYLFTSVKPHVRQSRLPELLQIYLETLTNTTENLGYPIPLTYDQLYTDFRRKFKFGFWFAAVLLTKAGHAPFNDIDPSKIDMSQWPTIFLQLINKWIANNPEESEENANILVSIVKEYKRLSLS